MAAAVAGSASAIGGTVAVVSSGSSTTGVEPIITVSLAGEPSSLHAAINSATLNAAITVRFIRLLGLDPPPLWHTGGGQKQPGQR